MRHYYVELALPKDTLFLNKSINKFNVMNNNYIYRLNMNFTLNRIAFNSKYKIQI